MILLGVGISIALVMPAAPIRGLDIHVAQDLDDALDEVGAEEAERESVKADAEQQLPTAP
jgi:solute:Na+ symporter, SSS family